VKHIVLFFYLWFGLLAQCHEPLLEEHNHSPQLHASSNPHTITNTQHIHGDNLPRPQRSYTQKNCYSNDLSATQKLGVVQKFMSYFSREQYSIPQTPIPAPTQPKITKPKQQQDKQNIPSCINTTEQAIAHIDPLISEIEDQLFIQQQSSEWDKHAAIIDARIHAINRAKNGNSTILQYSIHQEFITITEQNSKIRNQHKSCKTLHKMTRTVADFTDAGIAYNNNNEIKKALLLADACWMMLDCIQAVAEGLVDGALHIVDDIVHPIQTIQSITESAVICGYYIGKVAIEIGHLGYLVLIEHPNKTREKLGAWKCNFSLIYGAMQKKQSSLKTHDLIKESVSMGVQFYATPKVLHGLGRLFKQAHKQVIIFAQNIPALKKTHALTTPEGVVVRIADSVVEYMKSAQALAREIITKANNMVEFFNLPFGQKFKNKCIKTKKTYKNITSIYEIVEDIPGTKIKKGDLFYLDRMHKDHIEVFNSKRYTSTYVYNLDGTLNKEKSIKAFNRSIRQYIE